MFKIAVIPGDGIGPEVISEGMKVLDVLSETDALRLEMTTLEVGAARFLRTGETLTEEDVEILEEQDAIYFGAIGDPRVSPGTLEKGIILAMRSRFDQYVNLRPVRSWDAFGRLRDDRPFEMIFLRENTEDFYMGAGGRFPGGKGNVPLRIKRSLYDLDLSVSASSESQDDFAFEVGIMSRRGIRRFADYVLEYARESGRSRVTVVDKANVCTSLYGLWREVFASEARGKGIELEFMFVDAMAQAMVRDPSRFGVVATPNMFGDILTDLGAELQGSLGLAASGNINPKGVSMFEPIHGSAPDIAGRGIANPFGAILAAGLMLDHLGCGGAAKRVEAAVQHAMRKGIVTPDLGGKAKTAEAGDAIVEYLRKA